MPDLSHFWQRFVLASALVFGLALGVGATVFAYSNTQPVTVGWSVFHLRSVPLWTVVLVPIALVLVAGTLFHWYNGLHHFTEHMRHRHRVRELEAEVTSLRARLDSLLEMPERSEEEQKRAPEPGPEGEPAVVLPEPVASNGEDATPKKTKPVVVATSGKKDTETKTETASEKTAEA